MMLSQLFRALMFIGVTVVMSVVAITSLLLPKPTHLLWAQKTPQIPQTPQQTSTVSLNQVSNQLNSVWTATVSSNPILEQNHRNHSSCNCPVCQQIKV